MKAVNENPYVGPRTFEEKDGHLFFGREREANDLLSLVISERLVLFYAQSGAGKSSLINTRLIPGLRQERFDVLPIGRVSGELPEGITEVENIFSFNLLLSLDQNQSSLERLAHMTLSDYFQAYQSKPIYLDGDDEEDDEEPARLLIIDQFEEIVTTHLDRWSQREDFFKQLRQAMTNDPLLWVIMTMREDYLAALDPYARLLPGKLRVHFRMQRMGYQAALAAIEEPAKQGGQPFADGVSQALVDNLRQIHSQESENVHLGQFVEPVQLQVVCYQLWENLKDQSDGQEITYQDLQELGNVDVALAQFYEQALARVLKETGGSEFELRSWFGKQLITEAGTRGTVYQGPQQTANLANRSVELLANQFLLRAEMRAGGTWYELVHDRLIEPILQSNQTWFQENPLIQAAQIWQESGKNENSLYRGERLQETVANLPDIQAFGPLVAAFLAASQEAEQKQVEREARRQRELEQAQALAEVERQRAEVQALSVRRLRRLAIALVAMVLLALGAVAFAFNQTQVAEEQRLTAEAQTNRANQAREAAEASEEKALSAATAEAEALAEAEAERAEAQESLELLTTFYDDVSELMQGEQVVGVIGFAPVQRDLFELLVPFSEYIIQNSTESEGSWRSAQAHFRIGRAAEISGDSIQSEKEFLLAFEEAKAAAETLSLSGEVPEEEELLQILNETAVFYAWNRMNYGYIDEAESVLNDAKSFMDNYSGEQSPELIMSSAILENALSRLFIEREDDEESLKHQMLSVELARRAVSLDEENILFKRTLAVYLRNLSNTSKSLMPKEEADSYEREGCAIAREADQLQDSGAALISVIASCARDESFQKEPDDAVESLLNIRERLTIIIQLDPTNIELKLSRAWITVRLVNIEKFQRDDKETAEQYSQMVLIDWLDVVGNGNTFPTEVWKLRSVYLDLKRSITEYDDVKVQEEIFREIVTAIEKSNNVFGDSPEIALIAADSALQLGELQRESNPQESRVNLNKAIETFAKARVLDDTSTFNEQFEWVCRAYSQKLQLNYESGMIEKVLENLKTLNDTCAPIFDQYDFDFYLLQHLTGSHMRAGELLFNEGRFEEAMPILEYASNWGIKSSSELLAQMYREGLGVPIDISQAEELETLASWQSMKRFTAPADFGNSGESPFHVYIYQKPIDYTYKGIDDQVEWLKQARGGTISEEIIEAFRKLHDIALEHNMSFPELAACTIGDTEQNCKLEGFND